MGRAALYVRSSKDRHDVSIPDQRRQLRELALARGLSIETEFVDVVESGKDENRAGFQQMLRALKDPDRGWDTLLVLDTSRLARRRHISIVFEEVECKRRGVRVIYKSLPESDPITEMLLKSILQAMDEWHSLTSREKGLAGMRENLRQGYRAGGKAPIGYQLVRVAIGLVRDGAPVSKSKLEPSAEFDTIAKYLRDRAAGISRMRAAATAGLAFNDSTLVAIEWNALTYAGHSVWNVHAERISKGAGYVGGKRRRPRSEWVVQRDTHKAMISDAEAEALLVRLEAWNGSAGTHRRTKAKYLLTGILRTPEGAAWQSDGCDFYRVPGKRVPRDELEQAVVRKVTSDLLAPVFIRMLTKEARAQADQVTVDPAAEMRSKAASVGKEIDALVGMMAKLADPDPVLRKVESLELQRKALANRVAAADADWRTANALRSVTEHDVRRRLVELSNGIDEKDREGLKDVLGNIVDRIVLDPADVSRCAIHYRIGGNKVASPRGEKVLPELRLAVELIWRAA